MTGIHQLGSELAEPADLVGSKAHGLAVLCRLGLPVPPGFVIDTAACRAFLHDGRLPGGLPEAIAGLEARTGRRFGGDERPLIVSVRSGAAASMPGMMNTILNLGLTTTATAALAAEAGSAFAGDARQRLRAGFAEAVAGEPIPDDADRQLHMAVAAVFRSWNTPRARTYRELNAIAHHLGTAVIVQAMVFGNRDARSGSGVADSRDPTTGEPVPFGEVLFGHQGDAVVSGTALTRPLAELADREPAVWAGLLDAMRRTENHYRDACQLEFTFESGNLWLLQVRPGRLTGRAAVRVAVDLADEGLITRGDAVRRVRPRDIEHAHIPRLVSPDLLGRGIGASPGIATGRVATTSDAAVRMAATGPVILFRPQTSPLDLAGMAAATGILTTRGGPASHAAVVARAMAKPAVVSATNLHVDPGTLITIDGTTGHIALGAPPTTTDPHNPHLARLLTWAGGGQDDTAG
jgi:pyruvate,orthophosphate dikinase